MGRGSLKNETGFILLSAQLLLRVLVNTEHVTDVLTDAVRCVVSDGGDSHHIHAHANEYVHTTHPGKMLRQRKTCLPAFSIHRN